MPSGAPKGLRAAVVVVHGTGASGPSKTLDRFDRNTALAAARRRRRAGADVLASGRYLWSTKRAAPAIRPATRTGRPGPDRHLRDRWSYLMTGIPSARPRPDDAAAALAKAAVGASGPARRLAGSAPAASWPRSQRRSSSTLTGRRRSPSSPRCRCWALSQAGSFWGLHRSIARTVRWEQGRARARSRGPRRFRQPTSSTGATR